MKGFVDLQINGYQGVDFSAPGLTLDQVGQVVKALRQRGTIAFCPTVITSSPRIYEENLPVLAQAHNHPDLASHLLGIHLEGPFISPEEGARGAHSAENTLPPDPEFYRRLHEMAQGRVALVTLAPELPGSLNLIQEIVSSGVAVSLGHHLGDRKQIGLACDAGARASTHLGNGIPNLLPRHPNPIWDQLDEERLTLMLITDGHHLPDAFVRVVARLATSRRLVVVSDSAPVAGLNPGQYTTLGQKVLLEDSGRLWNPVGNHLVGSSRNLLECMNHLANLELFTEDELWRMGYHNPLALIQKNLDPGSFADFPQILFQDGKFQLGF